MLLKVLEYSNIDLKPFQSPWPYIWHISDNLFLYLIQWHHDRTCQQGRIRIMLQTMYICYVCQMPVSLCFSNMLRSCRESWSHWFFMINLVVLTESYWKIHTEPETSQTLHWLPGQIIFQTTSGVSRLKSRTSHYISLYLTIVINVINVQHQLLIFTITCQSKLTRWSVLRGPAHPPSSNTNLETFRTVLSSGTYRLQRHKPATRNTKNLKIIWTYEKKKQPS